LNVDVVFHCEPDTAAVLRMADLDFAMFAAECARFGLRCVLVCSREAIPGSYWGGSEAGLIGNCLYVRADTPVHSALHEASHFICMDHNRRQALNRDAGGDHAEENAVCYLQIVWASHFARVGRERMLADMDAWGYTFRLGSARAWFEHDADDARAWLERHGLLDADGRITYRLRQGGPDASLRETTC
jgi:hypothetical protein